MRRVASRLSVVLAVALLFSPARTTAASPKAAPVDKAAPADKTACAKWDVTGDWAFLQSNEVSPTFHLDLTDTGLHGTGHYYYLVDTSCPFFASCGKDAVTVDGPVDGSLDGDDLMVTAYWNNGMIGVYQGKINAQGRIEGTTFDRLHPQTNASWYSSTIARCLDGSGQGFGNIGTTSGAAKPPPPPPQKVIVGAVQRDARIPSMKTTTYTAIAVCDAARNAKTQNPLAAETLDGMCRNSQVAAAAATVVTGPSPATGVKPVETNATGLVRTRATLRVPAAANTPRTNAPVSATGAAAVTRTAMPYSLLRKDPRFGYVAAPGMALGVNQPANSIQVRVSYPRQFGYKTVKGPGGLFGPSSCDDFSVSATAGDGSSLTRITSDLTMTDAGDSYICGYLVSNVPLDQSITVHADVFDRVGAWQSGSEPQPPAGQQRLIANGSQTVTLKAAQNRARLNYEMGYAPLPGR